MTVYFILPGPRHRGIAYGGTLLHRGPTLTLVQAERKGRYSAIEEGERWVPNGDVFGSVAEALAAWDRRDSATTAPTPPVQ